MDKKIAYEKIFIVRVQKQDRYCKYKGKEFGASKAAEFSAEMRRWKWKVFENTPKMGPEARTGLRHGSYRGKIQLLQQEDNTCVRQRPIKRRIFILDAH